MFKGVMSGSFADKKLLCIKKQEWGKVLNVGFILLFLVACSQENPALEQETADQEREGPESIFYQQKKLVYKDSLQIRVLSWGEENFGNYLVLLSDSAGRHYVGDSFFREGVMVDAWVHDLDKDNLPEIGVVVKEKGGRAYGKVRLHELNKGFTFTTISLPQLSESLGADYGGYDSLYRRNDQIVREFSLLNREDSAEVNAGRRRIIYELENNQLKVSGSENFAR